jgi:glyoxylate/hydroxypyruvate reductase
MHLYVHTPLSEALQQSLGSQLPAGITPIFRVNLSPEEQKKAFSSAEIIMGNPPAPWWENPPTGLRFWQLDSAGFEVYRSLRLNIPVCNAGDYFAIPCAETMVGGVLALYRKLDYFAVLQTRKSWIGDAIRHDLRLLSRQKAIILGAGHIGIAVKRILQGFQCEVVVFARSNSQADLHSRADLENLLPTTDLVVSCLPGSAEGFCDAVFFAKMKPTAIFANVGRGKTVDETALIQSLQSGRLGGAVLDVTVQEPLPLESPLWDLPNVLLTQHSAGGFSTEDHGKVDFFLDNLRRFFQNQALSNQIDLSRGY